MRPAQRLRRSVVLSKFDLPDSGDLLVYSCEDCACAVSGTHDARHSVVPSLPDSAADGPWVCASGMVDYPLDAGHRLLFNPLGSGGVVVVNEIAHGVLRSFARPAVPGDTLSRQGVPRTEAAEVFRRLGQ